MGGEEELGKDLVHCVYCALAFRNYLGQKESNKNVPILFFFLSI